MRMAWGSAPQVGHIADEQYIVLHEAHGCRAVRPPLGTLWLAQTT
jgi:hypothetical protein